MIRIIWSWHLVATPLIALAATSSVVVLSRLDRHGIDVLSVERACISASWTTRLRSLLALFDAVQGRGVYAGSVSDPGKGVDSRR